VLSIDGYFSIGSATAGDLFGLPFKISNGAVCVGAEYYGARVVASMSIDVQHPLAACPAAAFRASDKYAPNDGEICGGAIGDIEMSYLFQPPAGLTAGTCYNASLQLTDATTHTVVTKYQP
jgi:hypothetical protein